MVWLCAADCTLSYMNETLFNLISFDYLILRFKVSGSAKNMRYFFDTSFLSFVSMVTGEESGTLLFPIDYGQIA